MLYRLLLCATLCALTISCSETTDKPVEKPTIRPQVPAPAQQSGQPTPRVETSEQPTAAVQGQPAETARVQEQRIVQVGPAPQEQGDDAPNRFFGMSGTLALDPMPGVVMATLIDVRSAQHEYFDRVTFEFSDTLFPGYRVEYVEKPAAACGSGRGVSVEGEGYIEVTFTPARAHNGKGKATVARREYKFAYPVMREVERTCDFEGTLRYIIGTKPANKFRLIQLSNPPRLCIDIKH